MPKPLARIHQNKQPIRRHYINEWLEERGMSAVELLDALNDQRHLAGVDKSQVYRWLKGQLPQSNMQERIAAVFQVEPDALLRHPADDWIARKLRGRSKEEVDRLRQMIELAFPSKTGTQ